MEEQVAQILSGLQSAVTTLAPEAWAALVAAARVDGFLSLSYSLLVLTVGTVWTLRLRRMWAWAERDDNEPLIAVTTGALVIASVIALVVLFSADTWLGIFYPEAAVLRDLLSRATK